MAKQQIDYYDSGNSLLSKNTSGLQTSLGEGRAAAKAAARSIAATTDVPVEMKKYLVRQADADRSTINEIYKAEAVDVKNRLQKEADKRGMFDWFTDWAASVGEKTHEQNAMSADANLRTRSEIDDKRDGAQKALKILIEERAIKEDEKDLLEGYNTGQMSDDLFNNGINSIRQREAELQKLKSENPNYDEQWESYRETHGNQVLDVMNDNFEKNRDYTFETPDEEEDLVRKAFAPLEEWVEKLGQENFGLRDSYENLGKLIAGDGGVSDYEVPSYTDMQSYIKNLSSDAFKQERQNYDAYSSILGDENIDKIINEKSGGFSYNANVTEGLSGIKQKASRDGIANPAYDNYKSPFTAAFKVDALKKDNDSAKEFLIEERSSFKKSAKEYGGHVTDAYRKRSEFIQQAPIDTYSTGERIRYGTGDLFGSVLSFQRKAPQLIANQAAIGVALKNGHKIVKSMPNKWLKGAAGSIYAGTLMLAGGDYARKQFQYIGMNEGRTVAQGEVLDPAIGNEFSKYGINYSNIDKATYAQLMGIDESQVPKDYTPMEMKTDIVMFGIKDGLVIDGQDVSSDINPFIKTQKQKTEAVARKSAIMTSGSDIAQTAIMSSVVGIGLLKNAMPYANVIKGTVGKMGAVGKYAVKSSDNAANWLRSGSKLSPILYPASKIVSKGAGVQFNRYLEGVEEGYQSYLTKEFQRDIDKAPATGDLNDRLSETWDVLRDATLTGATVASGVAFGRDNAFDPLDVAQDEDFWKSVQGGSDVALALGLLGMTGGSYSAVKNAQAEVHVEKIYGELMSRNIAIRNLFDKGHFYSNEDLDSNRKKQAVFSTLERMKTNLPPGVSVEDVDDEIKLANHLIAKSNSKSTVELLDKIGIVKGSEKHRAYMGAYAARYGEVVANESTMKEANKTFKVAIKNQEIDEFLDRIKIGGKEQTANTTTAGKITYRTGDKKLSNNEKDLVRDMIAQSMHYSASTGVVEFIGRLRSTGNLSSEAERKINIPFALQSAMSNIMSKSKSIDVIQSKLKKDYGWTEKEIQDVVDEFGILESYKEGSAASMAYAKANHNRLIISGQIKSSNEITLASLNGKKLKEVREEQKQSLKDKMSGKPTPTRKVVKLVDFDEKDNAKLKEIIGKIADNYENSFGSEKAPIGKRSKRRFDVPISELNYTQKEASVENELNQNPEVDKAKPVLNQTEQSSNNGSSSESVVDNSIETNKDLSTPILIGNDAAEQSAKMAPTDEAGLGVDEASMFINIEDAAPSDAVDLVNTMANLIDNETSAVVDVSILENIVDSSKESIEDPVEESIVELGDDNVIFTKEDKEIAVKRISDELNKKFTEQIIASPEDNLTPMEMAMLVGKVVGFYMEAGIIKFVDVCKNVLAEFPTEIKADVVKHIKAAYASSTMYLMQSIPNREDLKDITPPEEVLMYNESDILFDNAVASIPVTVNEEDEPNTAEIVEKILKEGTDNEKTIQSLNPSDKDNITNTVFISPGSSRTMTFHNGRYTGVTTETQGEFGEELWSPTFFDDHEISYQFASGKASIRQTVASKDQASIDNILINVVAENKKTGKIYSGILRSPYSEKTIEFGAVANENLRKHRANIISLFIDSEDSDLITPGVVRKIPGVIGSLAKARPLSEIKGFNIPANKFAIDLSTCKIGYASSAYNNFEVVTDFANTIKVGDTSGAMYYFHQVGKDRHVPITVLSRQMSSFNKNGKNPVLDFIVELLVDNKSSFTGNYKIDGEVYGRTGSIDTGIPIQTILRMLVNYGRDSISKDPKKVSPRQLFYENGILLLGNREIDISNGVTKEQRNEISKYINDNFYIKMNYDMFSQRLGDPNSQLNMTTFFVVNPDLDKLKLIPGVIEFTRDDVGLTLSKNGNIVSMSGAKANGITGLSWMITSGMLTSTATDNVVGPPFLYVSSPGVKKGASVYTAKKQDAIQETKDKVDTIAIERIFEKGNIEIKATDEEGSDVLTEIKPIAEIENIKPDTTLTPETNPLRRLIVSKKNKDGNIEPGAHRMLAEGEIRRSNVAEEISWLKDRLGLRDDQIEVLRDIITVAGNGVKAMGVCRADSIALFSGMEAGTAYHEAYHRVSLLLLTPEERSKIYEYAKNNIKELRFKSNKEIEEFLAEGFREYVQGLDDTAGFLSKLFEKIYNFIKTIASLNKNKIESLYRKINAGAFRDIDINSQSLKEFNVYYSNAAPFDILNHNFKYVSSGKQFDDIAMSLTNNLLILGNVTDLESAKENKVSLNNLKDMVAEIISNPEGYEEKTIGLFQDVLNNFSLFESAIISNLSSFDIVVEKLADGDEQIEGKDLTVDVTYHFKDDNKTSVNQRLGTEIKIFLSTITERINGVEVGDNNLGLAKFYPRQEASNRIYNKLSDVTEFSEMMDRIETFRKGDDFFQSLYEKIKQKNSEEFNSKILAAVRKHKHSYVEINVSDGNIYVKNLNTKAAIKRLPNLWSKTLALDPDNFSVDSNNNLLFNPDKIIQTISDFRLLKQSIINLRNIGTYNLPGYGNIQEIEGSSAIVSELTRLLNRAGITVNQETVISVVQEIALKNKIEFGDALINYIVNNNGISVSKIFENRLNSLVAKVTRPGSQDIKPGIGILLPESGNIGPAETIYMYKAGYAIFKLAEHYAMLHPNPNESSVRDSKNRNLYEIAQTNYITDIVNRIKKDEKVVDDLSKITYVSGESEDGIIGDGSMFLRQLMDAHNREKLELLTFANFKSNIPGDKGKSFEEMSSVEDYLMRIGLIEQNIVIPPTFADKSSLVMLNGIKFNHNPFDITYNSEENSWGIQYDINHLKQFDAYFRAEFNTIIEANKQKIRYIDKIDPETGIPIINNDLTERNGIGNYHITDPSKGGNARGDGNGMRFRYMDGLWIMKENEDTGNSSMEFVDFNKILDEKGMDAGMIEISEIFFSKSPSERYALINSNLNQIVETELSTASDLGIINQEEKGRISSISSTVLSKKSIDKALAQVNNSLVAIGIEKDIAFKTGLAVKQIIADFAINSTISHIEFEKIFTGDPAFYANPEDKVKRMGGALSTGANMRIDFPIDHELHGKTKFPVILLKDRIVDTDKSIVDELKKQFVSRFTPMYKESFEKLGYETDDDFNSRVATAVESAVDGKLKSFKGINSTDGTVFVSPQFYKEFLQRQGDFEKIEPAFNKLMNGEAITTKDLDLVLSPIKAVYFGGVMNFDESLNVPIFDKMAMFPIFEFYAKGDLKYLYDRMVDESNPVYMAAFESAVKVGSRAKHSFYNKDGEINNIYDAYVYEQNWEDLRKQMPTDPHEEDVTDAGTQIMKLALSGINKKENYKNVFGIGTNAEITGQEIIDSYMSAVNTLSDIGAKRIIDTYSTGIDENGDYIIDYEGLSTALIKDGLKAGMSYELAGMLGVVDGKFIMPLSALSNSRWIESRLISNISRETIDVRTPGGSFIQMCTFGIEITDGRLPDGYVVNNGKKLMFRNKYNCMDCVVSINMFKDIIPKGITFEQQRNWLIENNIIGQESEPQGIGYRIPTQALPSIPPIRAVDVLPSVYGDTIIMPDEFVSLSGTDFDIDKLYVLRYAYKKDGASKTEVSKEELNDIKKQFRSWLDETSHIVKQKANEEGEMVDITPEIVTNKDAYGEGSSAFSLFLSGTSNRYRFDKETATVVYNLSSKVQYNDNLTIEENSENAIINRMLDSLVTYLTSDNRTVETTTSIDSSTQMIKDIVKYIEGGRTDKPTSSVYYSSPSYNAYKKKENLGGKFGLAPFALNNPNHAMSQISELKFRDLKSVIEFGLKRVDKSYSDDLTNILDILSALINAHVDVAKDPYISRLNVNKATFNMVNLLVRTGKGESSFYFIAQDILKEFANEILLRNNNVTSDKGKTAWEIKNEVLASITNKYQENIDKLGGISDEEKAEIRKSILDTSNTTFNENGEASNVSLKTLKSQFKGKKDLMYYATQLEVLKAYIDIEADCANELSDLLHASQTDTKKSGNTFVSNMMFKRSVDKFMLFKGAFENASKLFTDTFLYTKFKNSVELGLSLFKNVLLTSSDGFMDTFSKIMLLSGNANTNSDEVINAVYKGINEAVRAEFFNKYAAENNINVKSLFSGNNTMVKQLFDLTRKMRLDPDSYSDIVVNGEISNYLLNALNSNDVYTMTQELEANKIGVNNKIKQPLEILEFLTFSMTKDGNEDFSSIMTSSFDELLNSNNEDVSNFAKNLFVYSYYASGWSMHSNSIFEYIPESFKLEAGYGEYYESLMQKINTDAFDSSQIIDDVFRNYYQNDKLVPEANIKKMVYPVNIPTPKLNPGGHVEVFSGTPILFAYPGRPIGRDENLNPVYRKFMKVTTNSEGLQGTKLYINVGTIDYNGKTHAIYQLTSKRGYNNGSRIIREGSVNSSIISANNINLPDFMDTKSLAEYIENDANIKVDDISTNVAYSNAIAIELSKLKNIYDTDTSIDTNVGFPIDIDEYAQAYDNKTVEDMVDVGMEETGNIAALKGFEKFIYGARISGNLISKVMYKISDNILSAEEGEYKDDVVSYANDLHKMYFDEYITEETYYSEEENMSESKEKIQYNTITDEQKDKLSTKFTEMSKEEIEIAFNKLSREEQDITLEC